ncbi:MAG: TRAP transporter substrate-binding protein DctP [Qingshengfaniella sp.]
MKVSFLTASAALLFGLLPGTVLAQEVTLRIADQFPLTHLASKLTIQPFIAEVEARSDGRIKFEHYPAEQLSKSRGMLDAVRSGVADLALQVAGQVSDRLPLSTVVELPSIGADIEQCFTAFQALAQSVLLEREYAPLGVRAIEVNCTPSQYMTTSAASIDTLDQLRGLKLRAGGSAVELTLKEVGATAVNMSAPDIYMSIERGTLDGAIFAPASTLGYKLENIVKGVAKNISFGSNAAILFMNERAFQKLPADLQQIILDVGREVGQDVAEAYNADTERSLGLLAEAGVNVYDLPGPVLEGVLAAQVKVSEAWVAQMDGRGLAGSATLEAAQAAAGLTN